MMGGDVLTGAKPASVVGNARNMSFSYYRNYN